ncbi:MAG: 16S rRNA (adenine(1518)-N(6)/adenine(1519)-N(6))-dimethyltransferase RsmA [Acidobacteriota bacterium]
MSRRDPHLKKRLGQHHLRDGALCRPLIDDLQPAGRRVLEIGPGGGVLTAELLASGARVIACEVDLEWAVALSERVLEQRGQLDIVAIDAQRIAWGALQPPTYVTGNLPFNVATRLIEALLPHGDRVPRAAFMVQKEVAERMVAQPGDRAYSSFSVLVAAQARARYLGTVRPGSFRPPPKVAAAFVGLRLMPPPLPSSRMADFTRLVRLAFAQRRKTLRNSLASGLGRERAETILRAAGLDFTCRAQDLDVEAFVALCEAVRELGE